MAIDDKLWHAIASGLLDWWLAELVAMTSISDRQVQEDKGSWPGAIRAKSYGAMGYTVSDRALNLVLREIVDRVDDPVIRDQTQEARPPLVLNAAESSGTLSCTDPGPSYETYVFSWNAGTREFTQVGELSTNNTPGTGVYVLSNTFASQAEADKTFGLPSQFLTIT